MLSSLKLIKIDNYRETLTLWMNHLLIVCSFLLPISERGRTAVFFTLIVLFFIRGNFRFYLKDIFQNKVVLSMVLFFIVHILWIYGTDNYSMARKVIDDMRYIVYPILILSFLDKRFAINVVVAFIFGMLYSEIISYLIHFDVLPVSLELFGKEIYTAQSAYNPSPFLIHSRYTLFLSITISIFLYNLFFLKSNIITMLFSILFITTASINLILIGGRIGYVSFVILIIFVIIYKYRQSSIKPVMFFMIIIMLFFMWAYSNSKMFKTRIDYSLNTLSTISVVDDYRSSFGQRLGIWIYSLPVIKENFLFGVGTGDQRDEVRAKIEEKHSYLHNVSNIHNEYVKNFLQFGLIGFIIFLNIFYQIVKYKTDTKYKKGLLLIITLAIAIGLMTSIFAKSKLYITVFVTILSALISNKVYFPTPIIISKKTLVIYFLLIFIYTTISWIQG